MVTANTTGNDFEKEIWKAADKMRGNIDASEYKSVVLGLIFLKYISDKFETKYNQLVAEGEGFEEDKDEYTAENIFYVPVDARWSKISAAAELKKRSDESGAGRFTDFSLPPLTFYEYIHLKSYANLMIPVDYTWENFTTKIYRTIDITKLNELFLEYINYGGYPEVVFSNKIKENPGQFIRHDIIDKVLLRDLPSLYGISDVQELNSLFTMIAYHSGAQFSYEKLSKESGVQKETLKRYINYLKAAFLIQVVKRTDDTAKSYQRETQFKIYLTNPSLRCALFEPINELDSEIGDMVETAVYAQWFPRQGVELRYANWRQGKQQGEVDIVGLNIARQKPYWAVEIKWSDHYYSNPGDLKSLVYFMDRNTMHDALVTSIKESGLKELNGKRLHFIPVACYAYIVGENTINQTKSLYGL